MGEKSRRVRMKNIINLLRKRRLENLTNKLIKELQTNGLKLSSTGSLIDIWVYRDKINMSYTGGGRIMDNYGSFPLHGDTKKEEE